MGERSSRMIVEVPRARATQDGALTAEMLQSRHLSFLEKDIKDVIRGKTTLHLDFDDSHSTLSSTLGGNPL